jgi:hypothetical protein
MQRRHFLQAGAATSALLALPVAANLAAAAPRFVLGHHAGTPDARWQPALARGTSGATRLRLTVEALTEGRALQPAHVDLVYRAAGRPAFCLASLHGAVQRTVLTLDADAIAGLRVHYAHDDAAGLRHEARQDLALTDALQPLLAPGTYALLGARAAGRLPAWNELAAPQSCRLDRCDGAAPDFDALLIHVAAV